MEFPFLCPIPIPTANVYFVITFNLTTCIENTHSMHLESLDLMMSLILILHRIAAFDTEVCTSEGALHHSGKNAMNRF